MIGKNDVVVDEDGTAFEDLLGGMKQAAAQLVAAEIPFMLAGGLASWARGGPPTEHDVDFMLKPEHVEAASRVLEDAGFRIEQPPEAWLRKAWLGEVMVDLIHHPVRRPVDDDMMARAEVLEVQAMAMPVMAADDILVTKLLALNEHHADFESVLEVGRALREQVDWDAVRRRTTESAFAKAYFVLVEELGLVGAAA